MTATLVGIMQKRFRLKFWRGLDREYVFAMGKLIGWVGAAETGGGHTTMPMNNFVRLKRQRKGETDRRGSLPHREYIKASLADHCIYCVYELHNF